MSVYELKISEKIVYNKIIEVTSNNINKEKINRIVELWSHYKNCSVYNSINIKLKDIILDKNTITMDLGYTCFYEFLISNIMRQQFDGFKEFILNNTDNASKKLITKLEEYYTSIKSEYNSLQDLIKNGNMANAIAVSVLVMDKFDNVMLVKRSNNVAVGKNLYSVTATGATDENDLDKNDPIKNCAIRELEEELNLKLELEDLCIKAIVAGKKKMQPIAIIDAVVPFNLEKIMIDGCEAKDFNFEIDKVFVFKKSYIKNILCNQKFTEAAEYHLSTIS